MDTYVSAQTRSENERADERFASAREAVMDSTSAVYWRTELKKDTDRLIAVAFAGRSRTRAAASAFLAELAAEPHRSMDDVLEGWLDDVLDVATGHAQDADVADAFERFRAECAVRLIGKHWGE